MKTIPINIPGNKGYIGMDEVTDPSLLPEGWLPLIQGINPNNGDLDGRNVGTGAALNTTNMGFNVYNQTEFRSSKGKNYILGYTDTGKICYTLTNWSDWDNTRFVKLSNGSDLIFETTTPQGSTLISGAPHVKVNFGVIGNIEVIVSNGMDDVYTITGKLNSSGFLEATLLKSDSTATTIENANFPPFLDMIYLGGFSIIHDGEVIRKSAPGDDKRFYSTVEERTNNIWDDNDWVAPGTPGESSFITSRFKHIGGLECLITTNNGVYWIGMEAGANGIPRLNILPVLIGAGCPTGACCVKWGTFYFLSNYNGGSWLGLQRGSAGGGKGEPVDIEAQNGWGVFEVAPGIATSLGLIKDSNFALVSDVIDTRQDWEGVPTGQRANVDCIANPGTIFINAKSKQTYTVGDPIISKETFAQMIYGPPVTDVTATWDTTYPVTKIYDDDPDKSTNATAYSVNTNYGLLKVTFNRPGVLGSYPVDTLQLGFLRSNKLFSQFPGGGFQFRGTSGANKWHSYTPKDILKNISTVYLQIGFTTQGSASERTSYYVYIPINFAAPINISGIHMFDIVPTTTANPATLKIGELYIEGVGGTTATYISNIRTVGNLTASTNLELGRFTSMFKKINNALYPKIYVRGGSSSTMDLVLSTTIATTNVIVGDSTITLASVTNVQVGDTLTTAATVETFFVKSISGSIVTITGTFAYTHAIGAAITIRGSNSNATTSTWSNWTELTLPQLYRGFDFRTLTRYGSSPVTYVQTHTDGNFYWQFKVTLDLDPVTGVSPLVDGIRLGCVKGTIPLSNHLMAVAPDDCLLLSAPATDSSTSNDQSLIINLRTNGPWKVAGQQINSMVQIGKDFIVNTGRNMAKLWKGKYNYIYTDGSTVDVPLLHKIITSEIRSIGFYWMKIRALIHKFTDFSSTTTTTATAGGDFEDEGAQQ